MPGQWDVSYHGGPDGLRRAWSGVPTARWEGAREAPGLKQRVHLRESEFSHGTGKGRADRGPEF